MIGSIKSKISAKKEEQLKSLTEQLGPNEQVLEVGVFSNFSKIAIFFGVAALTLIVPRFLNGQFIVVILLNILGMWMMVDAARVVFDINNSFIIATDKRIMGTAGGKEFCLYYGQIKQIGLNQVLFLDSGDPRTSIVIRNLKNRYDIHEIIVQHKK